tara:strand:+ start:4650 stop:4823 length:174 start_codon:yes stop_codon:yes gene_type:complete
MDSFAASIKVTKSLAAARSKSNVLLGDVSPEFEIAKQKYPTFEYASILTEAVLVLNV